MILPARAMRALLAATVLLLAPAGWASGPAESTDAQVSWEPAEPDIGDQVMLTIEVAVPENLLVTFPRFDEGLAGFAVTGRLATEPEQGVTGTRRWRQVYRLEPETTGDVALPDLTIVVSDPKTVEETPMVLSGITIPIRSLVPPDTDLRRITDARGVIALPSRAGTSLLWWLATLGALALVAFGAWRLWARRGTDALAPDEEPHDAALESLRRLEAEAAAVTDNERFHVEVAHVLRTYVRNAFRIDAPCRTTAETVQALRRARPGGANPDLLEPSLAQCDGVKFARATPGAADRARIVSAAMDFVAGTGAR